jgi:aminoglycoside phosphotransferase (APT) family kinase protein
VSARCDDVSDAELDEQRAGRIIATRLPALRGLPVSRAGAGYNHEVFAAGDSWLVRFPKGADRVDWLERELAILAVVGETVTTGVPRPELIAGPSAEYPYPFFAYRRICGVGADQSDVSDPVGLASDVGQMLEALHRVDPDRIPPTPAGWERLTLEYERSQLIATNGAAALLLAPELAARAEPYLAGAVLVPARRAPRRFIHGDICPDHLIVDPSTGRLSGVIDFTDAMTGDPVLDFVGLSALGGPQFVDHVRASYHLSLGEGFDATLEWLTRTLTLRWLAEAAAPDPLAVPKHVRWVELAFREAD